MIKMYNSFKMKWNDIEVKWLLHNLKTPYEISNNIPNLLMIYVLFIKY